MQLDLLRSILGELCFSLKFEDFIDEINASKERVIKIYNETYVENSINPDKTDYLESERRLLKNERFNLVLQFYYDEILMMHKALIIVMREIAERQFPIRIGHEYIEAQSLLALLQHILDRG